MGHAFRKGNQSQAMFIRQWLDYCIVKNPNQITSVVYIIIHPLRYPYGIEYYSLRHLCVCGEKVANKVCDM